MTKELKQKKGRPRVLSGDLGKKKDIEESPKKTYDFTEEEREEVLKDAPNEVLKYPEDLKNLWIQARVASLRVDTSKDRFFVFLNKKGEEQIVDLKCINIKAMILSRGGSMEDVNDAKEIKEEYLTPLLLDSSHKHNSLKRVLKEEKNLIYSIREGYSPEITEALISTFGEMNGIESTQKIIRAKLGVLLSSQELLRFYSLHKTEIEAKKTVFLASSNEYKIATESGRLQILNNILTDLNLKYEKYMRENKEDKALVFSREMRNILEQARKEVKGNELKLTVDGKIDIAATIHGQENVDRVMKNLPINALIIGLVAARSNLDPAILINQLCTSYYKNFNGFNKNVLGRDAIRLPGDVIRTYDWKELEEKNKKFIKELEPPTVEEATVVDLDRKERILKKLQQLKKL